MSLYEVEQSIQQVPSDETLGCFFQMRRRVSDQRQKNPLAPRTRN